MPYQQPRLTEMEPIVGAWIHMEHDVDGWDLRIGHRHFAGRHGDCEAEQYHGLSVAEMIDVIEATLLTLGHG